MKLELKGNQEMIPDSSFLDVLTPAGALSGAG